MGPRKRAFGGLGYVLFSGSRRISFSRQQCTRASKPSSPRSPGTACGPAPSSAPTEEAIALGMATSRGLNRQHRKVGGGGPQGSPRAVGTEGQLHIPAWPLHEAGLCNSPLLASISSPVKWAKRPPPPALAHSRTRSPLCRGRPPPWATPSVLPRGVPRRPSAGCSAGRLSGRWPDAAPDQCRPR